jgi:mannose-6-phosphate isomerase-like protein (cupin superfamily)
MDQGNPLKIIRFRHLNYLPAGHENPLHPGVWKKILFTSADLPPGKIKMINWSRLPVKKSFQPHFHENMHEIFILFSGTVRLEVNNIVTTLKPGDSVLVPLRSVHKMTNIGRTPALYLAVGLIRRSGGRTVIVPE